MILILLLVVILFMVFISTICIADIYHTTKMNRQDLDKILKLLDENKKDPS